MKKYFFELNNVYQLLKEQKIEQAAQDFVHTLQKYQQEHPKQEESLSVDFYTLATLLKIENALVNLDRNVFWKKVENFSNESHFKFLLKDCEIFIDHCMKQLPLNSDPFRTAQIQAMVEKHRDLAGLQYLLALALETEGSEKKNPEKIKQSLDIFARLAPLTRNKKPTDENQAQIKVFTQTRAVTLATYLRLLDTNQALNVLNEALNSGWILEASSDFYEFFTIRRESLINAMGVEAKNEKYFEQSHRKYLNDQTKVLTIFFVLIAIVVGALDIIPTQKSASGGLALILGLCLGLMGFLTIVLGLLSFKKVQGSILFIVGLISLISLVFWCKSIREIETQQLTAQTHIEKREDLKTEKSIEQSE